MGFKRVLTVLLFMITSYSQSFAQTAPLVTCSGSSLQVNAAFEKNKILFINMVDYSYNLVNAALPLESTATPQEELNWTITKDDFETNIASLGFVHNFVVGKTGANHDDVPAFVAFNKSEALVIVGLHGSRSLYDWESDLFTKMAPHPEFGIQGNVHEGYAIRYKQMQSELYRLLDYYLLSLDAATKSKLFILVTGHSLGAGMANMIVADLAANYGPRLFGAPYSNSKDNHFASWVLSPPRTCGDQACMDTTHAVVGKQNMISQYIDGDPVVAFVSGKDPAIQALTAVPEITAVPSTLTLLGRLAAQIPYNYLNYTVGNKAVESALGKEALAAQIASTMVVSAGAFFDDLFMKRIAILHYGGVTAAGDAWFAPQLVGTDTTSILNQTQTFASQDECEKSLQ